MKNILIVCAALAAAGCANPAPTFDDLTPAQRQKLLGMPYFADKPDRPYTVLGHVDGAACGSSAVDNNEDVQKKAMDGVMVKALLLGADGVTRTYCRSSEGADLLSMCKMPVKCYGDAIKFADQEAVPPPPASEPPSQPPSQPPSPPVEQPTEQPAEQPAAPAEQPAEPQPEAKPSPE